MEGTAVVVQLASRGVGHRFPTGDLFRRLTVTLTAHAEDGQVLAGETFHLHRDWDAHRASLRSRSAEALDGDGDTRLGSSPREFRVACETRPARVHLTVTYERGASAEGAFFEAFETSEILDVDLALDVR
jgi:hypothetical protein